MYFLIYSHGKKEKNEVNEEMKFYVCESGKIKNIAIIIISICYNNINRRLFYDFRSWVTKTFKIA